MALIVTVALMILLETLDVGQAMFFQAMLEDRARAGARYGVVHSFDAATIQNVVVYNAATAPPGQMHGLFGLTTSMVTATRLQAGATGDRIEVAITGFPLKFIGPFLSGNFQNRTFRVDMPVQSLGSSN